ncbi:heparinase II/III family protein [Labrys monachus]|uniref:Heparinase superfamily protein n=1 Tax=Labrys monachus TaxID=217067 RepID=A0ABU0FP59_9HYPH|nr:heparinase II/III family protein [Labrys monachus]MDQ0396397.1 putative heparinase superfamily protein [Labrys monachus]
MIGAKLRLSSLAARQSGRRALARLYISPLLRWRFGRGDPEKLLLAPQDLRASDPTRAAEIVSGRYTFAGKTINLNEVSPFVVTPPSPVWRETLLGFTWLRHLRAADGTAGRTAARRLIGEFVRSSLRFQPEVLEPVLTARRLLSWISQSPLVLDGADRGFHRAFVRSIAWQARYLLQAGSASADGMPRLTCAIATAQASLCFSDKVNLRRPATRWLAAELGRQVLSDGVHISRNPQAVIDLLLDLLPLRQSFAARNVLAPPELLGAIDRMMPMLRFFRHADGAFGAFNGMGYTQTHLIATLLAYDDARGKPVQNAPHGGYQRVEGNGAVLLVDTGRPPPLAVSHNAHAGTLSFEFSADNFRIVVNCGAPAQGRENWRHLARSTGAHSTAIVNDTSSSVFAEGARKPGMAGRVILSGPRTVTVKRETTPAAIAITASHDGYEGEFGLIHQRELTLSQITGALEGRDSFLDGKSHDGKRAPWKGTQPVLLRFHLHPAVAARPANGDTQIVLTLPNGKEWLFLADVPFTLAETAHLANPEGPRRSTQIVTALPPGENTISWAFLPAEPV